MMRAVTVWQPWGFAIARLGKGCENRTWCPPKGAVGQQLAFHAGQRLDEEAVGDLVALGHHVTLADLFRGGIVATCTLVGVVVRSGNARNAHRCGSAVGAPWYHVKDASVSPERIHEILQRDAGIWYAGDVGWVVDDVRALRDPVACKGAQGLWTLPTALEQRVREAA